METSEIEIEFSKVTNTLCGEMNKNTLRRKISTKIANKSLKRFNLTKNPTYLLKGMDKLHRLHETMYEDAISVSRDPFIVLKSINTMIIPHYNRSNRYCAICGIEYVNKWWYAVIHNNTKYFQFCSSHFKRGTSAWRDIFTVLFRRLQSYDKNNKYLSRIHLLNLRADRIRTLPSKPNEALKNLYSREMGY